MRWALSSALLLSLGLSACSDAPDAPDAADATAGSQRESGVVASDEGDAGASSVSDADGAEEAERVDATRAQPEVADAVAPSDVGPPDAVNEGEEALDLVEDVEVEAPPLWASCDISVTDQSGVYAQLVSTYEGYGENTFGAAVYGTMLKVWLSEGESAIELLIRMDQTTIPGEIVPGVPGNAAWVVMIIDDSEVYSTQPPSGVITLESCPSEEGALLSGTISGVVLFDMGDMTPVTIEGTFEVVVGDVSGEAICSGL